METKTLANLINEGIKEVFIKSYGYVEASLINSIWQPFGNKARYICFTINRHGDLSNKTFSFDTDEPELNDLFIFRNNRWESITDYDLFTRCR